MWQWRWTKGVLVIVVVLAERLGEEGTPCASIISCLRAWLWCVLLGAVMELAVMKRVGEGVFGVRTGVLRVLGLNGNFDFFGSRMQCIGLMTLMRCSSRTGGTNKENRDGRR